MARHTGPYGFTLIEILVATVIIVCILGMAYGSYVATSRSTRGCEAKMESSLYGYQTLQQMTRQLRCVHIPEQTRYPGDEKVRTAVQSPRGERGSEDEDICLFKGDSADPAGQILRFATTHALPCAQAQDCGLYDVTYKYDRLRRALLVAHENLNARGRPDDARKWQVLAEHVTEANLQFYDGRQWLGQWDFARQRRLPAAVKIDLVIADRRGAVHHYSTAVRPALAASQDRVLTPVGGLPDET